MFDHSGAAVVEGLEALVAALSRIGQGGASCGDGADGSKAGGSKAGGGPVSDVDRIDQLAALERVKAAAAAAQARVTAGFVESQEQVAQAWRERARECSDAGDFEGWRAAREQARLASVTDDDVAGSGGAGAGDGACAARRRRPRAVTGVATQVALARRESPVRGAQHVALAVALTRQMPHTLAALTAGQLSEWRAQIIVRESATVTAEQRRLVDAEVAGVLGARIGELGDRELARRVRAVAYRVDAASVMARATQAQTDRRVTIRPAPDTMAYVTALLPVAQAVAAHAALTLAADTARAGGDERGKGQVMADTFVTRLTGQATADAAPVEVQLVMTDRALLRRGPGDETPAQIPGYGTVPAAWARALLAPSPTTRTDTTRNDSTDSADRTGPDSPDNTGGERARVWLRRLYTHPVTGALVGMDSTRRTFDGGLRRYLLTRDASTCRTPWCEAPARHVDHIRDHADGGPTSADNGQGLCEQCNHTKQLPGWTARTIAPPGRTGLPDGHRPPGWRHTVEITTPTGHRYTSTSPPLLPGLPVSTDSPLERALASALAA